MSEEKNEAKKGKKKGGKKGAKKATGEAKEMPKGPDHPIQYLGKPTNNVSIGIVGMPNIGKSTLFNLMTHLNVEASNRCFCTIEPTDAKVAVPDPRFDHLCEHFKPKSKVPAVLTVTDIAGLVKGAHEGHGLGNAFLSHISQVDAIYHVCRAFKAKDVEHAEGDVDPTRDLEIISAELVQKDLAILKNALDSKVRKKGQGKPTKAEELELATWQKAVAALEAGTDIREVPWNAAEIPIVNSMHCLTAKPICYLVNVGTKDYTKGGNKWFMAIKEWTIKRSPGAPCIPFSAKFETEFETMPEEEKQKLEKSGRGSMIPKIIVQGYHALNMVHFFTCGEKEVRAWSIRRDTPAPKAAGVIHGDFETGFINCDQYHFDDYVANENSEQAVAKAGKQRTQGKTYIVQDGDILFFRSTKSSGKKK